VSGEGLSFVKAVFYRRKCPLTKGNDGDYLSVQGSAHVLKAESVFQGARSVSLFRRRLGLGRWEPQFACGFPEKSHSSNGRPLCALFFEIMPSNTTRIAKNTLALYFRMIISMAVSLYISRVVLQKLGVQDYGIYSVVGGVVAMFGFMHLSMSGVTQRFLSIELGKNDKIELQKVFNMSLLIHGLIVIVIVMLAETIGFWFFQTKMNIPAERMNAAFWVYQLSIVSCVIMVISAPYNALIIAHERMNVFAYISIVEVILKLLIVYVMSLFPYDILIVYALLLCAVQILIRVIYGIYCKRHFEETTFYLSRDRQLFKQMTSFAFWTMNGNLAFLGYTQGLNILLNLFFNPSVNAARGIAVQVQNAVMSLCRNFQTAINPQINKNYAVNNMVYMHNLIFTGSRFSFYLLLFLALPILFETEIILSIWLGIVPEHTVSFVRLILMISMFDAISRPLVTAVHATGRVRTFQLIEGSISLLIIPISYLFLKKGFMPEIVFVVHFCIEMIAQYARIFIVCPMIKLSKRTYFKQVLKQLAFVLLISPIAPLLIKWILPFSGKWPVFILVGLCCCISVLLCSYFFGISNDEKIMIKNTFKIKTLFKRIYKNFSF